MNDHFYSGQFKTSAWCFSSDELQRGCVTEIEMLSVDDKTARVLIEVHAEDSLKIKPNSVYKITIEEVK